MSTPTADEEQAQLFSRITELEREIGAARRTQFVRRYPVRGGVALTRAVIRKVGGRMVRLVRPGTVAELQPITGTSIGTDAAPRTPREREAHLGSLRGHVVILETELARAAQDVAIGWRPLLGRAIRRRREYWHGRMQSLRSRSRAAEAPRVSVLTAVYDTPRALLRQTLRSVSRQTLAAHEHVLVDDCSPSSQVRTVLAKAATRDHRRVVSFRQANGGIVAASSDALAAARGEYVALVDHDDLLEPTALARMVAALDARPDAVAAYSDHDILTADHREVTPLYKPDHSPERLRSQNYITHFVVARRAALLDVGGFRAGYDGAQDHDLLLRLGERGPVLHVPGVLYHWRMAPQSVATDANAKPYAYESGRRAVADHCARVGIQAEVEHGDLLGCYVVRRHLAARPLVSIIIPTRGSEATVWEERRVLVTAAIASIEATSTYPEVEYVIVADDTTPPQVLTALADVAGDRVRVVEFTGPFDFSRKCNLGARHAAGDVLLFLNDDTELIAPDSIEVMVGHLQDADVGMVGAKLFFADGRLQHVGHVYSGRADHALLGWPGDTEGPWRMAVVDRECSGVTAAAAAMRRDVFEALGGFDEAFPVNFNDVDLSLRVRAAGYRIIWTPRAQWFHFESATRDGSQTEAETDLLFRRWGHELHHDPYFNECLLPGRNDWLPRPLCSGVAADVLAVPSARRRRGRR